MDTSSRQGGPAVLTHAIRERNVPRDEIDLIVEALQIKGFCVADTDLTTEEIDFARRRADEIYLDQAAEIGGEENLKRMNDANIARGVCAFDPIFVRIATLPVLMETCRRLLGPYIILMSQNAILNRPGTDHYQFTWHRDLNYQHWTSSRPIALSVLICLDPFDSVTGGTYVLPATHKMERFPSDAYVLANQETVHARPGQAIFFDSMLFHRTGVNRSDIVRRGINHIVTPPFIRQQYSFPKMLAGAGIEDRAVLEYLGFGMETPDDVRTWRAGKLGAALNRS